MRHVLIIVTAAFLAVGGCRRPAEDGAGTLTVGIEVEPQTLDPRYATDAYSAKISDLLFPGLVDFSDSAEVRPRLAGSFEAVGDLKFRFHLRPGLRFSDGSPLTTDDVAATIRSVLDPDSTSPYHRLFQVIRDVRPLSSKEIEIDLRRPYAPFLSLMTLGILKQGAPVRLEFDPSTLIGAGPYRFVSRRSGEALVLKANPSYWGDPPLLPRLRFRVISDETTRALELLHGRIDLVMNGIPHLLLKMLERRGLQVISNPGINYSYLVFNLRHPALADRRVRRAIAQAIPVEDLIRHRLAGRARPAGGVLAPGHWAFEPMVRFYPFSPESAQRLLDEAGVMDPDGEGPRPRMTLTYKTSNRKDRVMLAKLIARYLGEVGIAVKVRPLEWGTFFSDVRSGNFDMSSLAWVGVAEPDIYFDLFHSTGVPPAGNNRGGYSNPRVDFLLEEGRKAADPVKRARFYREVQRIAADDLPYLSLWYEDNVIVAQSWVTGLRPDARASYGFLSQVGKGRP